MRVQGVGLGAFGFSHCLPGLFGFLLYIVKNKRLSEKWLVGPLLFGFLKVRKVELWLMINKEGRRWLRTDLVNWTTSIQITFHTWDH